MPRKKAHEMAYDAENYTVMANDIIRGKQSMTLQEARLIRLLITQVAQGDTDYQTYSCRIVDLAAFLGIPKNNIYRDIPDICKGLMQNVVYIGTGNKRSPWRMFHWVSLAEYDGAGTITLRLSDEIKPYVLDLEKWFTRYPLGNILAMRSYYSIRLYELIKCQDGVGRAEKDFIDFGVEELRQACGCEGKYQQIGQLKDRVIIPAVNEINENTDIWVEVEYLKTGRRITDIRFHVHDKPKKRQKKTAAGTDGIVKGEAMFYTEEEMRAFELFPEKTKEELIPILEFSIEQAKAEGDIYVPEVCGSVLRKIRQELAEKGASK